MRILITGGLGYLGGRLTHHLSHSGEHEIVIGSRRRVESLMVVQTQDLDVIVHLAAMNAPECAADPIAAIECNVIATARLLQAAVSRGVKRFVYLSTAHVYGSPLSGTITEQTPTWPAHPYATTHRAAEDLVRSAHHRREIEGVVIRLSNAFGAPVDAKANCWMLLVNDLCRQAISTGKMKLQSSGNQRRDFITMTDACRSIHHLLGLPTEQLGDGVFNVGGSWSPTIFEMAMITAERVHVVTGTKPEIAFKKRQSGEDVATLDYRTDKLRNTGFQFLGRNQIDKELDGLIQFCI